jgi:D-glycero-alpha-D-manno-heptose 1-phosphate guanylyltransferase
MDAIILAGGLGTRLKEVVNDVPKPMALVNGVPFLDYIIENLLRFNINRIILAVSFKYDVIIDYFGSKYKGIDILYSVEEDERLGTGGAIKKALEKTSGDYALILNGDTFLQINYKLIEQFFIANEPDILMVTKSMDNISRYGLVVSNNNRVIQFREKGNYKKGNINTGVYILHRHIFNNILATKFSLETDILEKKIKELLIMNYNCSGYFVDIGVPEDYYKANIELSKLSVFNT